MIRSKATIALAAALALVSLLALASTLPAAAEEKPATPAASAPAATTPATKTEPAAQEISITSKSPEAVELFKQGRDLLENVRPAAAAETFQQAIALDPDFALAHAFLGQAVPGSAGLEHLERAAALAKAQTLPEPERLEIDVFLAGRQGRDAEVVPLWQKLVAAAPGDFRAHQGLGTYLTFQNKWDQAIASLKKATELNPQAGASFNMLGYSYMFTGQNDKAIEAFRKYAALSPDEPNPHDSLGEALMEAGRFGEAEAAFKKAAEVSPDFWFAWTGVAQTRFLRGDWAGGREALAKAKAAATRAVDKLETDVFLAWSYVAEGNLATALKTIDGVETAAAADKSAGGFQAFAPIQRAMFLIDAGKNEDAIAEADKALAKAKTLDIAGDTQNAARRTAYSVRIDAESKLGRADAAKKTLALLEDELTQSPQTATLKSMTHFARGAEAMARGDAKAAAEHFAQCDARDYYFRYQLLKAQERAGDKAGAEATREELLAANGRDSDYLVVRAHVEEGAEAAAK